MGEQSGQPAPVILKQFYLNCLAHATADLDLAVVCGYVGRSLATTGKRALNSAAVLEGGKVTFRQSKMLLPTYDVFDEARYVVVEQPSIDARGPNTLANPQAVNIRP